MTNTINHVELQNLERISGEVTQINYDATTNANIEKLYREKLLVPWIGETGTPSIFERTDSSQLGKTTYEFFISYYSKFLEYLYFIATGDESKTSQLYNTVVENYTKNIPNVKLDSNFCYYAFCNVFRDIMKVSIDTYFSSPFAVDKNIILQIYNNYSLAAVGCPFDYFQILIILGKYSRFFFMSNPEVSKVYERTSQISPKVLYYMSLLNTQGKLFKEFIKDMTTLANYYRDNLNKIITERPILVQFFYFVKWTFKFIQDEMFPDIQMAKTLSTGDLSDMDKKVLTSYTLLFDINYFKTLLNKNRNKLVSELTTSRVVGRQRPGSVGDLTSSVPESETSLGFGRGPNHVMSLLSRSDKYSSDRSRSRVFRSPENTISKTESKFVLKKPLIYLGGSMGLSVTWRNRLIEKLGEFYYYNPNVQTITHGRERDAVLDSFYDDIAIQCADVLLFYIDFDNRCVDVISQVVFYMEIGYPMVLIIQNIPEYKFPESRQQLNILRDLVAKKANEKNVRVYRTFRDFERDNIVDGLISSEKLLANVAEIRSTLDSTAQMNSMGESFKRLTVKSPEINSVLFSQKPIVEQVQIDVGGQLITKDKTYSLSVSSAVHVSEYYGITLFYLFNRLGFDNYDFGFSEKDVVKIQTDFKKIKTELDVKELDTTFYDKAQQYQNNIRQYFESNTYTSDYSVEIQFTIHILVQVLRKNFKISFMREKDYVDELIKNNVYHSYFDLYVNKKVDWSSASTTPEYVVAIFAENYVLPFIREMNSARRYLVNFITLYPEVLQSNTHRALNHLAEIYGFTPVDPRVGTFEFAGNSINVGKRPNILVFYRILQYYYNTNNYVRRRSYKRIITERD